MLLDVVGVDACATVIIFVAHRADSIRVTPHAAAVFPKRAPPDAALAPDAASIDVMSNLLATLIGLLTMLGLVPASGESTPTTARAALTRPASSSIDTAAAQRPLPTAGAVDLKRYAGTWYELARLPVRFQDPASVSTATYAVSRDGSVSVENTSYIGDDPGYSIRGTAEPVRAGRTDRLRVRFGGFLRAIPTSEDGNYWVIALDRDYELALVGTPDRRYLWLLARDGEQFDEDLAQGWLERAAALGFDTDQIVFADWATRTMRDA